MSTNKKRLKPICTLLTCVLSFLNFHGAQIRRDQLKKGFVPCFSSRKKHKNINKVNGYDIELNVWCKTCIHNRECIRWQ